MATPFFEIKSRGTESNPFVDPWQVFQEGDLTIVHKNMPLPGFFPAFQELSGETLKEVTIPPDSYAAILFAKMFPLSEQFQALKEKKGLSAKDVLLAATEYFAYSSFGTLAPFKNLPPEYLPGAVTSLALIDFNEKIISTAHIGDSGMGFDRWFPQWEFDFGQPQEFQPLSEDQNWRFDLELFERVTLAGIAWHSQQSEDSLERSYKRKINTRGGVGVLNGQLNPDLIIEHTIPLTEVFALLFYTDGVNARGGEAVAHNAYNLMQTGDPSPLEQLRRMAVKANLHPIKRDDDGTVLAICLADSVHCYTRDYVGKDKYLDQQSWLGEKVRFDGWRFNPQTKILQPVFYCNHEIADHSF